MLSDLSVRAATTPDGPAAAEKHARARPRICILTETYHPVVGGGEKQAQCLAEDLVRRGLQTFIVTRRTDEALERSEVLDGITIRRIPPVGATHAARWLMVISSFCVLARMRWQYDVILVSGFKSLGVSAVLTSRLFGKVCILKADSNGEMSGAFFAAGLKGVGLTPSSVIVRPFLALRNVVLRQADHFVAITAGIENELTGEGVNPAVVRHLTNSVDTRRFCPVARAERARLRRQLGVREDDVVITYTGRLVTYKGLPALLAVADEIRRVHQNVTFVLVGSGGLDIHNCEAELRDYVTTRGLSDHVHFAGEVPNVQKYLQASDMFVLPTEDDAFPLSLVEAMACGLPVVATRVGGIPQIVTHGHDGVLIDPGNERQLNDALCRLIDTPSLSAALGAAAARTVQTRYARDIVADAYLTLFQSALGGRDSFS